MTIYDIAKEAGVSITTVSRVINQKPGIKQSTREKVQEVLDKYNYLPSSAAKGLAEKNTRTVVVITEDIRDIHYASTVYTIERGLRKHDIYCVILNSGEEQEQKVSCLEKAMQLRANGVILIGSTFEEKYIQRAIVRYLPNTPVVIANGYLNLPNVCGIVCDGRLGIKKMTGYFIEQGHTKIGYIGTERNASSRHKVEGYEDAMKEHNLTIYRQNIGQGDEVEAGKQATKELLDRIQDLTVLVYDKDVLAVGGIHYLKEAGYDVPGDIIVAGFDNSIFSKNFIPPFSSVDDKIGIMGTKCVQALFEMIEDGTTVAEMMLIPEIVIR